MAAQQADQREQLYAVDVSTLEVRQVKCMSVDTRSDGKKMKTLLFDDGTRLAVVASPLPKGARNLADCVDRNDPDHEDLLKEHMLWRLAESWCPEDQTVPTATELAEVRELTPAVTACIPFCYRFLHILAAHMNGCKAEHVTTRVVVDVVAFALLLAVPCRSAALRLAAASSVSCLTIMVCILCEATSL